MYCAPQCKQEFNVHIDGGLKLIDIYFCLFHHIFCILFVQSTEINVDCGCFSSALFLLLRHATVEFDTKKISYSSRDTTPEFGLIWLMAPATLGGITSAEGLYEQL
jgi:hypothetical protein